MREKSDISFLTAKSRPKSPLSVQEKLKRRRRPLLRFRKPRLFSLLRLCSGFMSWLISQQLHCLFMVASGLCWKVNPQLCVRLNNGVQNSLTDWNPKASENFLFNFCRLWKPLGFQKSLFLTKQNTNKFLVSCPFSCLQLTVKQQLIMFRLD